MFYRNHSSKHLSIQVVTLAAGLALATTAIISGSEVLKERGGGSSASVAPRVESVTPQFATMADAVAAEAGLAGAPTPGWQTTLADRPVTADEPMFANEVDASVQSIVQAGR